MTERAERARGRLIGELVGRRVLDDAGALHLEERLDRGMPLLDAVAEMGVPMAKALGLASRITGFRLAGGPKVTMPAFVPQSSMFATLGGVAFVDDKGQLAVAYGRLETALAQAYEGHDDGGVEHDVYLADPSEVEAGLRNLAEDAAAPALPFVSAEVAADIDEAESGELGAIFYGDTEMASGPPSGVGEPQTVADEGAMEAGAAPAMVSLPEAPSVEVASSIDAVVDGTPAEAFEGSDPDGFDGGEGALPETDYFQQVTEVALSLSAISQWPSLQAPVSEIVEKPTSPVSLDNLTGSALPAETGSVEATRQRSGSGVVPAQVVTDPPAAEIPTIPVPAPTDDAPHLSSLELLPTLDPPPADLPRYRFVKLLEKSPAAEVYAAVDTEANLGDGKARMVAVKIEPPWSLDKAAGDRLVREALALASLRHENVLCFLDCGVADDRPYITTELLPSTSLLSLIRTVGRFPPALAILAIDRLLRGLDAAHQLGVIHRDITPRALRLGSDGEWKLTDFTFARRGGDDTVTSAMEIVGTPAYMSPERVTGLKGDTRSDLYSVGVVLYEMLAGYNPFFHADPNVTRLRVHEGRFPPLLEVCPAAPAALAHLVHKLLSRSPRDRFETPQQARKAMEPVVGLLRRLYPNLSRDLAKDAGAAVVHAANEQMRAEAQLAQKLYAKGQPEASALRIYRAHLLTGLGPEESGAKPPALPPGFYYGRPAPLSAELPDAAYMNEQSLSARSGRSVVADLIWSARLAHYHDDKVALARVDELIGHDFSPLL